MASICDRADSAMINLWQQCREIAPPFLTSWLRDDFDSVEKAVYTLWNRIERFENEFTCLRIFLDCIHKWSDVEVLLHLGSLVNKLEVAIQEISNKLIENIKLPLERPLHSGSPISKVLRKIDDRSLKRKVSKLRDLFSSLMYKVMDLKPEIKEAYDSLTSHSFQFRFHYYHWKEFSQFVNNYEAACSKRAYYYNSPLNKHFKDLNHKLILATRFLDHLPESSFKNLKTKDAMIHVGRVAISSALRLCEWWGVEMNRNNVIDSLLELRQKIDLTNPDFVDMNLKLLRAVSENRVDNFVEWLFPLPKDYFLHLHHLERPYTLHMELKSLVISVVNMRVDAKNVPRLLADAKVLLAKVAKLRTLCNYSNLDEAETMVQSLLREIWLIKLEIFLRQQLNPDRILQMSMKEQIDALNQGLSHLNYEECLKFLKMLIEHSPEGNIEKVKLFFTLMEEVGKVVASLDRFIHAEEIAIAKEIVRNELFMLLLMIVLFKADSLVMNVHINNPSLEVFDKNQIESLHKGIDFFTMFVKDQPEGHVKEAKLEFAHIEEVACGVTSLCHSLPTNNITEEAINNMNLLVSDLLKKIRAIMVDLKDNYLHAPRFSFPKTNGLGFIDTLLEKLRDLLKAGLTVSVKHQIEEILGDLKFLTPFLTDILEQDIEVQELKDIGARIVDVAYEAEYYIDSMMLEDSVEWHNSLWFYHLLQDIKLVKTSATKIYDKAYQLKVQNVPQTSVHKETRSTTPPIDEAVVVLNDQEKMIIDRLIGGRPQLDIVSIVGMPGIGKTTLAKQVYSSPSVVPHFHIRMWCSISEIYRKREVLLEILSCITPLTDEILGMPDGDLDLQLRKLLLKNKYLIVIDDVWNTEALQNLRESLPNDGNGSRILITSRHHNVAIKANPLGDPHCLRELSVDESWKLLQMKLFDKQHCPKELREIGEKIAESCKGLPLAIVAMAGLLEKIDRLHNRWKEIAEDLKSQIVNDPQEQCRKILELSYNHLPDVLKACFLYLGAFLEDQDIPAQKLTRLWIAEGFVQKTELKSLEDLAEDYLIDLISRNLIIFSQQRARGGAKTCRVHDVIRRLCQSKAREDRFLHVMTRSDQSNASSLDLDYAVSANFSNPSSSIRYEDHRLCFCSEREYFIHSRPSGPYVRSLLFIATNDKDPRCPYDISFISYNFRLLKVLDLECINMGTSFPSGLELLMNLRYLAVAGYIDSVPSSIASLWNLETFVVKGLKGKIRLPDTIWCLKKLRHVHASDIVVMNLQDDQHVNSFQLDYLVTLSSPFLCFGKYTDNTLGRFPNLRKLKCIFSESWDDSQNCNQFPRLEVLTQLESLKISYHGRALHPGAFIFPMNLKKLTLSKFHLPWNKISVIGQLPKLEVLKLLSEAFDGQMWDMMEGEFSELKFLKLDSLNIAKWNACSDHLPKLQQLVLRCCMHLEEVPSSITGIPTLRKIDVQWCGNRVEESVRQIKAEGDEMLKVFINLDELDV